MTKHINETPWEKLRTICLILLVVFMGIGILGCGEREKKAEELVLGNWTQYRNRAYILLIINPKGTWQSSVRIADATSKIVSAKGAAKGSWHMEEDQLIFTVVESDIQEIWEKNDTSFFEIVELGERLMLLKEENGRVAEWKKTGTTQSKANQEDVAKEILMAPYTVNLNRNSSNEQNRYLCLNMTLVLKELMPDQKIPKFHPRARDAANLFLSSLVYEDVEDFEKIKIQKEKLKDVLNPYMEGFIKEIEVRHVIIATSVAKVEEFVIEHTMGKASQKDQNGEDQEKTETN
ncbi:MAG: flagellar basal body-associated FliL family protein [Desulfobacter sp.]|nr:MAG: flagellar basal body-associated FliL family protein [Desulfobacter sp.]